VSAALGQRGLVIVAGTIFDELVDAANLTSLPRQKDEICALITKLPRVPLEEGQRFATPYPTSMD
jgi:inosose dehydratase